MGRRAASGEEPDEPVHLDDEEHAWWTDAEVGQPSPLPPPSARDALADHFGTDWRRTFGLDGAQVDADAPLDDPEDPPGATDPYAVLGLDPSATWDEIVAAHRTLARTHHPDRPGGSDDAMAALNAAYRELEVRRAR